MNKKQIMSLILLTVMIFSTYQLKQSTISSAENTTVGMEKLNYNAYDLNVSSVDMENLKEYKVPMIISFGTSNCLICKEMKPMFEDINKRYQGKMLVKFINLTEFREAKADFPFVLSPVQFFYDKDGNAVKFKNTDIKIEYIYDENGNLTHSRHDGFISPEDMQKLIDEMGV